MRTIGLIKEGKIPQDSRVAFTPAQCKAMQLKYSNLKFLVQPSDTRCFSNNEYEKMGITLTDDLSSCDIILGIKEIPVEMLLPNKKYFFFSHTRKKQPYNQKLLQAIIEKKISLIDYECLEHEDGQRVLGFGFFAGIVGAHNGIWAYGKRTGLYNLPRVYQCKDYRSLINYYFELKLPNIKIAVTGSGRVAHGIIEIMNLMGITEVEKEEYLENQFTYPVYVQLKSTDLYEHIETGKYNRRDFHLNPKNYICKFEPFITQTDILMNGVYWDKGIPALFSKEDVVKKSFRIKTISDVTDDTNGSVPINLGDQDIFNPVYGVDKNNFEKTAAYIDSSVDVIAIGNLPNELPRDASRYFGEQLMKFILDDIFDFKTEVLQKATITQNGKLTEHFNYLQDYANGKL